MDHAMVTGLKLAAVAALILANGVFVAAEFALVAARSTRVDELAQHGDLRARAARRLQTHLQSAIAAVQLGVTMCSIAIGAIGESALANAIRPALGNIPSEGVAVAIGFVVMTATTIVVGELAPKSMALARPTRVVLAIAQPMLAFQVLFRPVIWALDFLGRGTARLLGAEPVSEHGERLSPTEVKMLVAQAARMGTFTAEEEELIIRALEFSRMSVRQVMVPRTEIVALPADISLAGLLQAIGRSSHTRFPIYRDTLDNVVGILYVHEILHRVGELRPEGFSVARFTREPLTVPETAEVRQLLSEMRRRQVQIALVIDEYGGTAGIVTIEDLLERIIGEVRDEFERPLPEVVMLPDGTALVDGLMLIEDLNRRFGLSLSDEEYDTVGGYVFGMLGRRPQLGDEVTIEGARARVEELDGLRISRVRLVVPQRAASSAPPAPVTD